MNVHEHGLRRLALTSAGILTSVLLAVGGVATTASAQTTDQRAESRTRNTAGATSAAAAAPVVRPTDIPSSVRVLSYVTR